MANKKHWKNIRDYLPGDNVRDFSRNRNGSVVRRNGEETVIVRFELDGDEEVRISDIERLNR